MLAVKGKRITVLGMGSSGMAAAKLLSNLGAEVIVSDKENKEELKKNIVQLHSRGIKIEVGGHKESTIINSELVVVSPGVPLDIPSLEKAKKEGISIIGEIELAYQLFPDFPFIAVTGTNGKTTTVTLIREILKAGGYPVITAGNIGIPLTQEIVKASPQHIIVVEVSSFQLETMERFKPKVSIVLNISEDHLDRYAQVSAYLQAKKRIFVNQNNQDFAILNMDNFYMKQTEFTQKIRAQIIPFSCQRKLKRGIFVENDEIISSLDDFKGEICHREEISLKGPHNLENVLAAIALSLLYKVKLNVLKKVLRNFRPLAHRLEYVDEIKGVKFINDSKGTNVEAVRRALQSFTEPILLIAGGKDKKSDFTKWRDLIKQKVKTLILLGESKGRIKEAVDFENVIEVKTIEEAVAKAYSLSSARDCVLLSPGCTSFDMFKNFEERGETFKKAVKKLKLN